MWKSFFLLRLSPALDTHQPPRTNIPLHKNFVNKKNKFIFFLIFLRRDYVKEFATFSSICPVAPPRPALPINIKSFLNFLIFCCVGVCVSCLVEPSKTVTFSRISILLPGSFVFFVGEFQECGMSFDDFDGEGTKGQQLKVLESWSFHGGERL